MTTPFLGQIRLVAFNFAPQGHALCNGQTLSIQQNTALFSLLGTTYGGDGRSTFQLPNLQSRVPVHAGQGNGLSAYVLGQAGGSETHTLSTQEMPTHSHTLNAVSEPATLSTPSNNFLAQAPVGLGNIYAPAGDSRLVAMNANAIIPSGGNQPHENRQPLLTLNFVIALQGIFPARN